MAPSPEKSPNSLIEKSLTGTLTPEEFSELEGQLHTSPILRERYLQAIQSHLDLEQLTEELPRLLDVPINRYSHFRPYSAAGILLAGSLLTVLFLIGGQRAGMFRPSDHQNDLSVIAASVVPVVKQGVSTTKDHSPIIVDAANAKIFGEGLEPTPGETITIGREYILTQGFLSLEFERGAKAIIQAPSVFTVTDAETLRIQNGQCSVHAPPGAEGFKILSPTAEVIDLGTRFFVDVTETGETELLVVEGAASIAHRPQTSEPVLLQQGGTARVEPGLPLAVSSQERLPPNYREQLPDRVVNYDTTLDDNGFADELNSVTVQRGGILMKYQREDLIRSRLTSFVSLSQTATFCTRTEEELPAGDDRLALLDEDWSLVTGIINPRLLDHDAEGASDQPVFSVEFLSPVINGPGPDILLFDLQLLVYPPYGDLLRVRSGDEAYPAILNVHQFDINLTSPYARNLKRHRTYRALTSTTSLDDLLNNEFRHGNQVHVDAKAIVLGIDLSELGYAEDEALTKLDLLEIFEKHTIDPVLIVALPRFEATTPRSSTLE